MIKAVIFDYGGVVHASYSHTLEDIAKVYRISKNKLAKIISPYIDNFVKGLIDEDKFWTDLSRALNKPAPVAKDQILRTGYEKEFRIYPEIIILVKKLRKDHFKTAVLSNTIPPHVEIIKKHHGYQGFDVVVLSCEVGLRKPEKEIYQLALKKLNTEPSESLFIDNKKDFLKPAQSLGIKTIWAKNPEQVVASVIKLVYGGNG